jgi:hypothetical protein
VNQVGGAEGGEEIPQHSRQVDQVNQVGGEPADTTRGLTVEQLAEAKRLPVDLLIGLGCETVKFLGPPAVRIPYTDEAGEVAGERYRLALTSEPKFRWKSGTKAKMLLYGAGRLREAREAGYVILDEGETDQWTLTHHGFPAVALPGASMWSEEHAARLDGIETVYVVAEPDRGGKTLLDALRTSSIRPWVRVIRLAVKDVSELHLLDEKGFAATFKEAMRTAMSLAQIEEEARREHAVEEWARCEGLARQPDILEVFATELRSRGFVGSVDTPKLIYLVLVSRLLRRPVSVVLRGLSSAGKSHNVESVLPFFPESAYANRSGMSERALVYSAESYEHRLLYVAEADGVAEGLGAYFLRTLISENRLVYETVEKERDRLVTRVIEKPGPTGVILTTTKIRLDAQAETRMLALTVPDDPELTKAIMKAIAVRDDEFVEAEPPEAWCALQTWLELGGQRRVVDEAGFFTAVAERVPAVAVRLRRDFALVRSLVFAHAILHQASRDRDERGRIVAILADYAAVRELIAGIVAEGIGATVSDDVRETVAAVERVVAKGSRGPEIPTATRAQVQTELDLDRRATNRRLAQAVDGGYLTNLNPGRGKTAEYVIGDPIPEDRDVLPDPADLAPAPDNLANLANLALDRGDLDPPPSPAVVCAKHPNGAIWQARDFSWRCRICEPPFPSEVIDEAGPLHEEDDW